MNDEDDSMSPSFTFIANSDCISMYCDLPDNANPAQIKLLVEMLEIISFNNELVHEKVMSTLADIDHPARNLILSLMPKKHIKEAPAINPISVWRG